MSTLRTAAQQALEAIDRALPHAPHHSVFDVLADCADDLRAALAEPVQEPLSIVEIIGHTCECVDDGTFNMDCAIDFARAIERAHNIGT